MAGEHLLASSVVVISYSQGHSQIDLVCQWMLAFCTVSVLHLAALLGQNRAAWMADTLGL